MTTPQHTPRRQRRHDRLDSSPRRNRSDAARIAARMSACMRSHGFDAPTAPADFKRWIGEQQQAGSAKTLDDALGACKMALAPQGKADDAGKSDRGAPTDKPPAPKPETSADHTNSK
jgi:hypothetical protein